MILPGAAYTEKAGHLRQPRRPRAARRQGGVRAGRRARGLDDPARAVRCAGRHASAFDSFDELRAAMVAEVPALRQRGAGRRSAGRRRALTPTAEAGAIGYPIKDFYLTNADLPRERRRCSAARPNCSTARTSRRRRNDRASSRSWGMTYDWAWFARDHRRHPADRAAADAGGGDDHLCRPQDLGGDGAAARAERGRAVRPAAELRRRAQGVPAGNDHPVGARTRACS